MENRNVIKFFLEIHDEVLEKSTDHSLWIEYFNGFSEIIANMLKDCNVPNPNIKAMILIVSLDSVGFEMAHFPELSKGFDTELLKQEFYELFVGNYQNKADRMR
jgi:hypothetical protein